MADETLVVDLDGSGVEAGARRLDATLKAVVSDMAAVDRAFARVDRTADKSRRAIDDFAAEAERLNRVSLILGGALGDVTGGLDDFAVLLKGGAGRVTAFGAAAVAGTAAVTALGRAIVTTLANTSDYVEALTDAERVRFDEQVKSAREAEKAIAALAREGSKLQLLFSSEFAGTLTSISDALGGVARTASGLTGSGVLDAVGGALLRAAGLGGLSEVGAVQRAIDEARGAERRAADAMAALDLLAAERALAQAEKDRQEAAAEAAKQQEEAGRRAEELARKRLDAARMLLEMEGRLHLATMRTTMALQASETANISRADTGVKGANRLVEAEVLIRDTTQQTANAQADAARQYQQQRIQGEISAANSVVQIAGDTASSLIEIARYINEQSSASRREQAMVNWRLALTEAIIGTAQASVNALATAPNIIVGAIQAALALALGSVQIDTIRRNKPSAHSGLLPGLAPDETYSGGRRVLNDERGAVLTARGRRELPDSMIARANAGEPVGGGVPAVVVMLDGRAVRTRRLARPDHGYGLAG